MKEIEKTGIFGKIWLMKGGGVRGLSSPPSKVKGTRPSRPPGNGALLSRRQMGLSCQERAPITSTNDTVIPLEDPSLCLRSTIR